MATIIFLLTLAGGPVLARWLWLHSERMEIAEDSRIGCIDGPGDLSKPSNALVVYDPNGKTKPITSPLHGRVIRRLEYKIEGDRVEVRWEFKQKYIHRGFFLTAQCSVNGGYWHMLPLAPHEDSGCWIESINYGESRNYLFTVKKYYKFFFGLIEEQPEVIVCDQISFAVRYGKEIKEEKEFYRDKREILSERHEHAKLERDFRKLTAPEPKPAPVAPPQKVSGMDAIKKRRQRRIELSNYFEKEKQNITLNSKWSVERKRKEIEQLKRDIEEMEMREE
jgi:hypothetical protein